MPRQKDCGPVPRPLQGHHERDAVVGCDGRRAALLARALLGQGTERERGRNRDTHRTVSGTVWPSSLAERGRTQRWQTRGIFAICRTRGSSLDAFHTPVDTRAHVRRLLSLRLLVIWCSPWRARASGIRQEFYASSSVFARSISCACCRKRRERETAKTTL
jgi:hypothetical protein